MSNLAAAARITGRAVLALERAIDAEHGPDPGQLRTVAEALYDGAALLMQAAADLEA